MFLTINDSLHFQILYQQKRSQATFLILLLNHPCHGQLCESAEIGEFEFICEYLTFENILR